jgi:hypothetical protein
MGIIALRKRNVMTRVTRILTLCFFALVFSSRAHAQALKSFTPDSLKFIEELSGLFDNSNKKEGKDFIEDQFKKTCWLVPGKWTPARRVFVYNTCNELLNRRFRPYPEIQNFLLSLMNFYKTGLSDKTWNDWQAVMEKMLAKKGNNKQVSDMLQTFALLFEGSIFNRSNALTWSASSGEYSIEYDSIPKITFKITDLICAVKADTAIIYNTTGVYYPTQDKWSGKGGKVTWTRTGVDENTIYAELKNYTLKFTKQGYEADSVVFYNKIYFPKPIIGKLTEKAVPDASPSTASYPRFESYSKRFQIPGIANNKNIDYDGGFSMVGARFVGSGSKGQDATITIKRDNKKFMVAASKGFTFKKDKIFSDESKITMYLDTDTIYHPGLQFSYNIEKREVNLIRSEEGIAKTPYFNSFHMVDMYVQQINWKVDSSYMYLRTLIGTTQGTAGFESNNYYRRDRYDQFMMQDEVHPLTNLKDYSKKNGGIQVFSGTDYAHYLKTELQNIAPMLVQLSNAGFIIYDVQDDMITIKQRLYDYSYARMGKKDYDVIAITSNVQGGTNNAIMNLLNYDLRIFGVQSIFLSDSQNVYIYPNKGEIVLKKNRNFDFAGNVHAGLFDFYGKKFNFNYDRFKIDLNDVDSLRMSVKETGPDGMPRIVKVKTVVENINGELLVDDMGNRSGIKSQQYPNYPIFKSNKESFVYYNKRSIQRGVYKKDNFYFKLDPFTIDSLDNFSPKGLKLDGDFVSAGIFPQMRQQLTIQPDYSLGFVMQTPPDGLALYGSKGKFNATVKLSHKGLQGDGSISYLTSTAHSKDILFYPDSVEANAEDWVVKEQGKGSKVEYPPVTGDTVYIHWAPKKDIMSVYSKEKPFDVFTGEMTLKGRIDYRPVEMTARGKSEFYGSELTSEKYHLKNKRFDCDTANFKLKALEQNVFAFSTVNVNAHIDFEKYEGRFKSNSKKGSVVTFDVNKYMCYMDEFTWRMKKNNIDITSSNAKMTQNPDGTVNFTGPEFISIHPKQDSLRFFAPHASFDLKNFIISANEVPYINTGDARVKPDSGNVTILKDAVMKTLFNSTIIANSVTKYHTIYNATVNIASRKNYSATGKYDYVDELKKKQTIFFNNISVDTTFQTYADADIRDTSHFMLSPNFEFRGKVHLRATDQFLIFDGAAFIQHGCNAIGKSWFRFRSQIDPNSIYIPVSDNPVDAEDNSLAASIMSTTTLGDSNQFYTAFLSKRLSKNDVEVLSASGYLFFDKPSREYRIASKEKLVERSLVGNYLSLNANKCIVYGEGKMNLGTDLGQVKVDYVGNATHDLNRDSAYFDMMILLDFFFSNDALDKMADVLANEQTLQGTNFGRPTFEKGLREFIGKEKADKLISELNLYGRPKRFPDELEKSMFLTDLKMFWDPESKSYISCGPIGIGNIRKTQVNKMVKGVVQLKRKRGGDELNIYIEIDAGNWWYFSYSNGIMQAISSKEDFNNIIKGVKDDDRKMKVESGQKPYQYSLGSDTKKTLWLKKVKKCE